jgi:quercetin dioxygenase-like cupin family protein
VSLSNGPRVETTGAAGAASRRRSAIVRAGTGSRRQLRAGRGEVTGLVGPEEGSELDVHVNSIRGGAGPGPYHLHTASENVYYVLEGRVRLRIDGADHVLGPGDAAFIAAGIPHSVSVVEDGAARVIEIYSPAQPDFVVVEDSGAGA